MPGFRVKGSTGQIPQTVWFSALADKYNMLYPLDDINLTKLHTVISLPANYGNQWTRVTSSLGAFVTAPDGTTNTAQKLVEDSTASSQHYLLAGFGQNYGYFITRIACYAKAATRTRIVLVSGIYTFLGSVQMHGVFDLANGVAVTPTSTAFASTFTNLQSTIIPAGNGWYLCILDGILRFSPGDVNVSNAHKQFFQILLDNGSGSAPESSTYNGDGTSGAYIWRTNSLPPRAWGLNSVTQFDDFNDLSTVDVNNTKAPNFHWYVDTYWPQNSGWAQGSALPPGSPHMTASGSVLTFTPVLGSEVLKYPGSQFTQGQYLMSASFTGRRQQFFITASSFTTASTTITMATSNTGSVLPGMNVHNNTPGSFVGVVLSWIGTTLTLTAAAYNNGANGDQLIFTAGYEGSRSPNSYPSWQLTDNDPGYVGNIFKPPLCIEVAIKVTDVPLAGGGKAGGAGMSRWGLAQLMRPYNPFLLPNSPLPPTFKQNFNVFYDAFGRQIGTGEEEVSEMNVSTDYVPGNSIFDYCSSPTADEIGHGVNYVGFTPWSANHPYFGAPQSHVQYLGVYYTGVAGMGVAPPGGGWVVWPSSETEPIIPSLLDIFNTFVTYTTIFLPATTNDVAHWMYFCNGAFVKDVAAGPLVVTAFVSQLCWQTMADGYVLGIGTQIAGANNYDFVRIIQ